MPKFAKYVCFTRRADNTRTTMMTDDDDKVENLRIRRLTFVRETRDCVFGDVDGTRHYRTMTATHMRFAPAVASY